MLRNIRSFLFENKSTRQTIAKNTVWLSISNFGSKIIKAAIVIYAARVLGTSGYGVFSYAVTLAGFLSIFMDLGVNGILTRNASKASPEEQRALFDTTFAIKLILLILGIAVVMGIAPLFTTLPGAKALLPAVALILAIDTLRDLLFSMIRALEKMEWEAGIFLFTNIAIVGIGFAFLYFAPTPRSFSWGYALGDAAGLVLALGIFHAYFRNALSRASYKLSKTILVAAWPFAISGALALLFTNTDILIISWMRSASEVGIYSAAIRIIQTLYLIPTVIQASTLPLLARLAGKDNAKFRIGLERTLTMVFCISVPLSLGGIILGTPLMEFIFGAPYASGGLAFKILMATLMFDFAATIIINALFAYEHQRSLAVSSALGAVANVGFDLLLIPFFGMAGSAVATLIAQIANNAYLWHSMKKVNYFSVMPHLGKIALAGGGMATLCIALSIAHVNLILNIVLSCLAYAGLLVAFREPLLKEMKGMIPVPRP